MTDTASEIFDQLLEHGTIYQHVDPKNIPNVARYTYSVGQTLQGRAEFLIAGMPEDVGHLLLREVIKLDSQRALGIDKQITLPGGYHVKIVECAPNVLLGAIAAFGRCEARQVVWKQDGEYPTGRGTEQQVLFPIEGAL